MDEKQTLQAHIDTLFEHADAPKSRAAYELREELLSNSMDRYEDLTKSGMESDAAIQNVIDNIGDVEELIAALPKDDAGSDDWQGAGRQRSAMITTIAVGLYILAGVLFFVGMFIASMYWDEFSMIVLAAVALFCIIPTCLLVYNAQTRPKYQKRADTVVEEFKEWSNDSKREKSIRGSISSVIWAICLITYFLVSFTTGAWYITWVLFLVAACAEAVVTLLTNMRNLK